jgi:hypothetical protein
MIAIPKELRQAVQEYKLPYYKLQKCPHILIIYRKCIVQCRKHFAQNRFFMLS